MPAPNACRGDVTGVADCDWRADLPGGKHQQERDDDQRAASRACVCAAGTIILPGEYTDLRIYEFTDLRF